MARETDKCCKCRYFNRYYVKSNTDFNKIEYGFCLEKRRTVGAHDKCEIYKTKPKRKAPNETALRVLSNLLTQISLVRQLLEEEFNDRAEL